ncbi:matrilysin family metalloendoprotease [Streptomyces sp. LX-29]|uniref:matrixin family metalloprotease n=1 Tax=Streptomyces sp. LX-29 TaxID=2900152 RepID=UPI00240D6419|nr:matrixin family metalloprotease [Streptomyces sp. LX-29]WFB06746.1 matrilysin family metalloendoprotease [Streptomyces sp. LX-29]
MATETVVAFPKIASVPTVRVGEEARGLERVQDFLRRFGYLAGSSSANRVDGTTSHALEKYQEFNGLTVTGEFDEATRDAMTQPRCAMPDMRLGIEAVTTCGWTRTDLTFAFDTGTDDAAGNQEFDAVRNAFQTWAAAAPLTFTEVEKDQSPDILIGWRPASDTDLSMVGGTLAHADFPPACGVVTDGSLPKPVHFDDSEHNWSIGAAVNSFDVETVALHELGHILGLAHTSASGAVMLPVVSSNSTKRALTQDDIDGVRSLYPDGARRQEVARTREAREAWFGWESRGGSVTSDIAVGRHTDGRMEIFAAGLDRAVWHNWQMVPNDGWSGWASLQGGITTDIAIGRNADGRMEIFAGGLDNAVWHRWQVAPSGGWSPGWNSLGGGITSNIAVGRNADGRMEIFARGLDNAVWHKWQVAPNGRWSPGWNSLGGGITSNIAVGRNADGRMEIFARGLDGAVWHRRQAVPSGGWSGWDSLGGGITSEITVGQNADGRLEIFARGLDGAVWQKWQVSPGGGWSGWSSLGGGITSNIALGTNVDGRMEIFARGLDNAVWHRWQVVPSNGWSPGWSSLGGGITSDISVGRNADGRMEIFARGLDNAVWHKWRTSA